MPPYARYWKNPQKHRKEARMRQAKLAALGIRYIDQLTPEAAVRKKQHASIAVKAKRKTNPAPALAAEHRYAAKLKRLFGTKTPHTVWQYHMLKEAKNAKARKLRLTKLCP